VVLLVVVRVVAMRGRLPNRADVVSVVSRRRWPPAVNPFA
jgi:hypothetical protein